MRFQTKNLQLFKIPKLGWAWKQTVEKNNESNRVESCRLGPTIFESINAPVDLVISSIWILSQN